MAEFGLRLVICLAWVTLFVQSFEIFQNLIPNGNKVPNPCANGSSIYEPVGHKSSNKEKASKETLNRFGQDFNATGKNWTVTLCKMDSDGDGKSNGVELGDPNCKWVNDRNSTLLPPTGHPGICEPSSSKCASNHTC
ncbi:hypothetical protein ACJMK2_035658 [Sinanodonta woodiana]|uniref:Temptin Cys/Cys disulfide domain-containing protein n=1 Tax=Sinanodonta woodiana TaxID=1069815 RepID=A0ABD3WW79_SINWO